MSESPAKGLWAIAAAGSLLLHGSIGMALYAMPIPEPRKQSRTEIDIAALMASAAAQAAAAEKAAIADPHRKAAIVAPQDQASIAAEATPVLAAVQPQPVELGSSSPMALEPVILAGAPALAAHDTLAPETAAKEEAVATAPENQVEPATVLPESAPVASSEAAQPVEVATIAAGEAQPETASVPQLVPGTREGALRVTAEMAPGLAEKSPVAEAATRSEIEPIASVSEGTPSVALNDAATVAANQTVISSSLSPATAQPDQPAKPNSESTAPSNETAVAAGKAKRNGATVAAVSATQPSVLAASPQPVGAAPTGPAALAPQPETVMAVSPILGGAGAIDNEQTVSLARPRVGGAQVVASPETSQPAMPTGDRASAEEKSTVIAALPQGSVNVGDGSGAAKPNRLPITDFLAKREDGDCLLAIPTGTGPTTARIEAFAVEESVVERLGDEYRRLSGIPVKADTRPVSQDQCIALTFARSLPQYPNFLLRVSLAKPVIESGQELAGVVSGLRKDTIYLVVVDDEGKAELASSYSGQRASIVNFNAPMTLTSGPVSSVQLLIAIASDGPLQTVPHRPGMPAEDFFSKLATEIVVGQRSIAFGMTSFVVR